MGCKNIQIRFFDEVDFVHLKDILNTFNGTKFRAIYLLIKFSKEYTEEELTLLCKNNLRIEEVFVHGSPFNKKIDIELPCLVYYTTQRVKEESHCGYISPHYFRSNFETFIESQKYNNCLNRKISIDRRGYIKNCPALKLTYGKISTNNSLRNALSKDDFKKYWYIHKDQIEICKDCEFRYICTDCRAFLKNETDIYSQPLKCNYNPYTAEWATNNK